MTAKSDVVVKLTLVFFIALLSFSIGTFVGKKYSDNQHKLASLEPSSHETREVASIVDSDGKVESAVKDDEIAKIASEFADDETTQTKADVQAVVEGKHGEDKAEEAKDEGHHEIATHEQEKGEDKVAPKEEHKAETQGESKTVSREASAAAKNLVAGHAPVPANKPDVKVEHRAPSSLPKDVANYAVGKFTVQVAAYLTEAEAHSHADKLKKQGYSAFYVPAIVKGTQRYRVSVGLFASEKEAKEYRSEFMEKAKVDNSIVQKIN